MLSTNAFAALTLEDKASSCSTSDEEEGKIQGSVRGKSQAYQKRKQRHQVRRDIPEEEEVSSIEINGVKTDVAAASSKASKSGVDVAPINEISVVDGKKMSGRELRLRKPLVWIDLEMTGLDVDTDHILQIACIITDGNLKTVVEGEEIVVHQPDAVLENMNAWCVKQHGVSGLTQASRASKVSIEEAEQKTLEFVWKFIPEPGRARLAGNSIYVDVIFLRKWMPRLLNHFHYRLVDVTTVGELAKRWYPRAANETPRKKNTHTAMNDIRDSITQLRFYKETIFK